MGLWLCWLETGILGPGCLETLLASELVSLVQFLPRSKMDAAIFPFIVLFIHQWLKEKFFFDQGIDLQIRSHIPPMQIWIHQVHQLSHDAGRGAQRCWWRSFLGVMMQRVDGSILSLSVGGRCNWGGVYGGGLWCTPTCVSALISSRCEPLRHPSDIAIPHCEDTVASVLVRALWHETGHESSLKSGTWVVLRQGLGNRFSLFRGNGSPEDSYPPLFLFLSLARMFKRSPFFGILIFLLSPRLSAPTSCKSHSHSYSYTYSQDNPPLPILIPIPTAVE